MTLSHDKPCKQLQYNDVSTTNTTRKSKEPRFVPYEPYKAAVNPLVSQKRKNKLIRSEESNSEPINERKEAERQENSDCEIVHTENKSPEELEDSNKSNDDPKMNISSINAIESITLELEKTKQLLAETNKKLENSEKQLQIQIQVQLLSDQSWSEFGQI